MQMHDPIIRQLNADDGQHLAALLDNNENYGQYFSPFTADCDQLEKRLSDAVEDRYWGIWFLNKLVGFFMLRGFDEGYSKPSFGVFISEKYSNKGLSKTALDYALSWCQLNNVSAIMLKVDPENIHAKHSYEKAGFSPAGKCQVTGHEIMEIHWG